MKTARYVRKKRHHHKRNRSLVWLAALLVAAGWRANADQTQTGTPPVPPTAAKPDEKGPPLPLHQIEGNGGIFSTLSAYLVNPPRNGEPVGRPAVGFSYVDLGHGQDLEALTLTESPLRP